MPSHKVVALITPPVSLFELSCLVEIFGLKREELSDWYSLAIATTFQEPMPLTATTMNLTDIAGAWMFEQADTIIVPSYPVDRAPRPDDIDVIVRAFRRGTRILSICSGSFLLAAAGILDGRRATTHWRYVERFRRLFPDVNLEPDILYAEDDGIITSAGSAAGLDMMLHVVRSDFGPEACNIVARRLNIAPHRDGGQAQFVPRPVPAIADNRINKLVQWMRDHCRRPLSIEELASRVAMSPRNFYRHFRAVTGHTPYDWLLRERIGIAMELLDKGQANLDQIAEAAGFNSSDALRIQFQKIVGVAPTAYRRMYAANSTEATDHSRVRRVA